MKRIVAAALLLVLSFTVAFTSNYLIINKMTSISEKLRNLNEASSAMTADELGIMTEEIINEWESSEWIVHAFISADTVTETERSLKILDELAKDGKTDEFEAQCIEAYSRIESVCSCEKINKENIF